MRKIRIGLVIPSSNTTMETEFWQMASDWASLHTARIRLQSIKVSDLERMEEKMLEAALCLSDAGVDIIGYGCTSGSLVRGGDHFKEIERKVTGATGIPAVATAGAVVAALEHLSLRNISVATPYTEEINELERVFLEQHHKSVLMIEGLNVVANREVGRMAPWIAYELAKKVCMPGSDGLFLSCTNLRTIEIIDRLEIELKIPVISSNTATLWTMMKALGIKEKIEGYGQLLSFR